MAYLIFAGLFLLVAIAAFALHPVAKREGSKGALITGIVALVLLGLLTLTMSITTVGARAVGIQTAFGKYQNTLSNGLQLTAPWSSVEEFSTRIQSLDLDGEKDGVKVTFKGGGGGQVNLTPRWQIDPDKAGDLWRKYKTFDTVRDKLVDPAARDATRIVAANYTPNEARSGENLVAVRDGIEKVLAEELADDGIKIDSVSVRDIPLDKRSQDSLDKIVEATNKVERAKQEQLQAKIEAETAKIRQQGGALTPEALVRQCLDVTDKWSSTNNGELPPGWNCFSQPQVLIGAKK